MELTVNSPEYNTSIQPDDRYNGIGEEDGVIKWCIMLPWTTILATFWNGAIVVTAWLSFVVLNKNYQRQGTVDWIIAGAQTTNSITFKARTTKENINDRLVVESTTDGIVFETSLLLQHIGEPVMIDTNSSANDADQDSLEDRLVTSSTDDTTNNSYSALRDAPLTVTVTVTNLTSSTTYYYARLATDGSIVREGQIRTAPDAKQGFRFATAACATTGSQHSIFSTIQEQEEPLFFLHLGDFHYADLNTTSITERFTKGFDMVLGSQTQSQLLSNTGLVYMYDDHDWLGSNSYGSNELGRDAALHAYQSAIPVVSYGTNASLGRRPAMYHAFTIGSVRFIVSDLRAESSLEHIYSEKQKQWLMAELAQTASYDFMVWVTPSPWIGEDPGDDSWMGHVQDRAELSEFISSRFHKTQNLLAIAGDAHMLAWDDGSHTYYGNRTDTSGLSSFPLLQTGPLDRYGSVKGGPYSEGCTSRQLERNHHYSVVEYVPGETPCLNVSAYRFTWMNYRELVFHKKLCGAMFTAVDGSSPGDCGMSILSTQNWLFLSSALLCLFLTFVVQCFCIGASLLGSVTRTILVLLAVGLTAAAGLFGPMVRNEPLDTMPFLVLLFVQMVMLLFLVSCGACVSKRRQRRREILNYTFG